MAAALANDIPVAEYAPLRVKQAITGNGAASKEQVAEMLKRMLAFAEIPKFLDATDALAIAYCHFLTSQLKATIGDTDKGGGVKIPKSHGNSASWEDFVKQNPGRVKIN